MTYQFIVTYNIYRNGNLLGSGLCTRMSDTFYLTKEASDEIAAYIEGVVGKGNVYADQVIIRIKE